jgi:hypothetical protein
VHREELKRIFRLFSPIEDRDNVRGKKEEYKTMTEKQSKTTSPVINQPEKKEKLLRMKACYDQHASHFNIKFPSSEKSDTQRAPRPKA